jgi:hypothetical protein
MESAAGLGVDQLLDIAYSVVKKPQCVLSLGKQSCPENALPKFETCVHEGRGASGMMASCMRHGG